MKIFGAKPKSRPRFFIQLPKKPITIPSFENQAEVRVRYPLLPPYAFSDIRWNSKEKKLIYNIVEPELSRKEQTSLERIEKGLSQMIDVKMSVFDSSTAVFYLQDKVNEVTEDLNIVLKEDSYKRIMYYITRDFLGLNEIEALMHDPYIEDIGCNGLNTPVYVVHRKFGSVETGLVYRDPERLSDFVVKIAERCGRYISYAVPLLDGSLPDGSRVQAVLAKDVTTRGPTFSIRKFRANPMSPIDVISLGTTDLDIMAYLWILIQYNVSLMVCGGVSTGKTTFLNLLSMFIPEEDRVVSIEDTREINLPHENWVPSVSRMGFGIPDTRGRKYGEVTLFDLLRESFRQNPDYVIVGEVRGREAYVMFQGMASGHASLGTIHAGSVEDVIKRLQTPPIELSPSLVESLDAVVVMTNAKEIGKSARRVKEIVEIQSVDSHTGRAYTRETFSWIPSSDTFRNSTMESELLRRISFQEGMPYHKLTEELDRRKEVLSWMYRHDITEFKRVCEFVNLYYKDPDTLMKWVKENVSPHTLKHKPSKRVKRSAPKDKAKT